MNKSQGDHPAELAGATGSAPLLKALLKEAEGLLVAHHDSSLCTFFGECPVCSHNHTERYPNNIFGRIERALAPPNAEIRRGGPGQ